MNPTQQKIISHLENGPLSHCEVAKILDIRRIDALAQLEDLLLFNLIERKKNGKYDLRKEVAG